MTHATEHRAAREKQVIEDLKARRKKVDERLDVLRQQQLATAAELADLDDLITRLEKRQP